MTVQMRNISIISESRLAAKDGERSVVRFSTSFGVSGTAFRRNGYDETSYDIVEAFAIPEPPGTTARDKEQFVQVGTNVGEFEVIGRIEMLFEGGWSISVESNGLTFFVDEGEHRGPLGAVGTWVKIRIRNFTLWIGESP